MELPMSIYYPTCILPSCILGLTIAIPSQWTFRLYGICFCYVMRIMIDLESRLWLKSETVHERERVFPSSIIV